VLLLLLALPRPRGALRGLLGNGRAVPGAGGSAFFIDSARSDLASAADHKLPNPEEQVMQRRLADGREYRIVKRFYEPDELRLRLAELGWDATVEMTPEFFVYGHATPAAA
jgi:hypothetical protein